MTKPTSLSLLMPTIDRLFSAVIATLLPTEMQYHLAGAMAAVAIGAVALSLVTEISSWIRRLPLQHRILLRMPRLVRSTFPVLSMVITALSTIRTFSHSISPLSHQRFHLRIVKAAML